MFIGHFGLAFGAKKAAPAASLGTLFAGASGVVYALIQRWSGSRTKK